MKHASANSTFLHRARLGLAAVMILAGTGLAHAQNIVATPNKDGTATTVEVTGAARDAKGVVEVVNSESKVVATLYAGTMKQMPKTTFSYAGYKPGVYTLRYRENLEIKFDTEIKRPDAPDGKWVSPTDIKVTPMGIYVYDAGMPDNQAAPKATATIFKFNKDLSSDLAFAKGGSLGVGYRPNTLSFAVDEKGSIFIGSSHFVSVFDWKGAPQPFRVGSTEDHLKNPKASTTWVGAIALGENNKIYITSKSPLKVYDRTKNSVDGILYSINFKENPNISIGPSITASGNTLYIADAKNQITKFTDDGKTLTRNYATAHKPAELIFGPTGLTTSGNLLWVAARGPGPGPFWDSGGGDEILLYWDNGTSLQLFQRYGTPGTIPDAVQFHQPIGLAVSADGSKLYVAEDGRGDSRAPQGSPLGNARVRVFDIKPKSTAQTIISIK